MAFDKWPVPCGTALHLASAGARPPGPPRRSQHFRADRRLLVCRKKSPDREARGRKRGVQGPERKVLETSLLPGRLGRPTASAGKRTHLDTGSPKTCLPRELQPQRQTQGPRAPTLLHGLCRRTQPYWRGSSAHSLASYGVRLQLLPTLLRDGDHARYARALPKPVCVSLTQLIFAVLPPQKLQHKMLVLNLHVSSNPQRASTPSSVLTLLSLLHESSQIPRSINKQ